MLPVMHRIAGDTYVFQQDSAPAHRARDTVQLLQQETPMHPTCGRQTAQTWTRSITVSGVSCRNDFTRLQCVTQLTSSGASLRLGRAFRRLSSTQPLTSGDFHYQPASKQRDVTSSTRCIQPTLFRATHIISKKIAILRLNISNILLTQNTQLYA